MRPRLAMPRYLSTDPARVPIRRVLRSSLRIVEVSLSSYAVFISRY